MVLQVHLALNFNKNTHDCYWKLLNLDVFHKFQRADTSKPNAMLFYVKEDFIQEKTLNPQFFIYIEIQFTNLAGFQVPNLCMVSIGGRGVCVSVNWVRPPCCSTPLLCDDSMLTIDITQFR
jgi:hypothetical protein